MLSVRALELSFKKRDRCIQNCSNGFAFSRNLPLHLLAEFQRMIDLFECFGSPSRSTHDHCSVA